MRMHPCAQGCQCRGHLPFFGTNPNNVLRADIISNEMSLTTIQAPAPGSKNKRRVFHGISENTKIHRHRPNCPTRQHGGFSASIIWKYLNAPNLRHHRRENRDVVSMSRKHRWDRNVRVYDPSIKAFARTKKARRYRLSVSWQREEMGCVSKVVAISPRRSCIEDAHRSIVAHVCSPCLLYSSEKLGQSTPRTESHPCRVVLRQLASHLFVSFPLCGGGQDIWRVT